MQPLKNKLAEQKFPKKLIIWWFLTLFKIIKVYNLDC